MARKIDLNKIPTGWITIDQSGKVIIANPEFAESIKDLLQELATDITDGTSIPARNGGCNCPTE